MREALVLIKTRDQPDQFNGFSAVAHDPTEINRQGPDTGTLFPFERAAPKLHSEVTNVRALFAREILTRSFDVAKCLKRWWPGTESNRRRRPFQGRALPTELPGRALGKTGKYRESTKERQLRRKTVLCQISYRISLTDSG